MNWIEKQWWFGNMQKIFKWSLFYVLYFILHLLRFEMNSAFKYYVFFFDKTMINSFPISMKDICFGDSFFLLCFSLFFFFCLVVIWRKNETISPHSLPRNHEINKSPQFSLHVLLGHSDLDMADPVFAMDVNQHIFSLALRLVKGVFLSFSNKMQMVLPESFNFQRCVWIWTSSLRIRVGSLNIINEWSSWTLSLSFRLNSFLDSLAQQVHGVHITQLYQKTEW